MKKSYLGQYGTIKKIIIKSNYYDQYSAFVHFNKKVYCAIAYLAIMQKNHREMRFRSLKA